MRRSLSTAGFTLVEMLVALSIGAFGIAVAASVVRATVRQSGRGSQISQLNSARRILSQQLRTDIELAGYGSTGAIGCNPTSPAFQLICLEVPPAGSAKFAIPAVRGANNLVSLQVGTGPSMLAGSDAVQLVVPDPATTQRSLAVAGGGTPVQVALPMNCPIVLVSDHSSPSGHGRTQLLRNLTPGGLSVTTGVPLVFDIAAGSDVMCARVSTYWVDTAGWLHRSDLGLAGAVAFGATDLTAVEPSDAERIAPGVVDMQIAYRMTSETPGIGRGAQGNQRWAFNGPDDPNDPPLLAGAAEDALGELVTPDPLQRARNWFEVRQVRVSLLVRTLRPIEARGDNLTDAATHKLEDRAAAINIPRGYARQVIRATAMVTNLRYFDMNAPQGLAAAPY